MSLPDDLIDSVVGVIDIFRPAGDGVLTGWTGLDWPGLVALLCRDPGRGVRGGVAGVRGRHGDSLVLAGVELTGLSHVQRGQSRHRPLGNIRSSLDFAGVPVVVVGVENEINST